MWCPEDLKLNKFKPVSLPSAREVFKRGVLNGVGQQLPSEAAYGGEESTAPDFHQDKLGQIHAAENDILDSMDNE